MCGKLIRNTFPTSNASRFNKYYIKPEFYHKRKYVMRMNNLKYTSLSYIKQKVKKKTISKTQILGQRRDNAEKNKFLKLYLHLNRNDALLPFKNTGEEKNLTWDFSYGSCNGECEIILNAWNIQKLWNPNYCIGCW